jgi:hypothetical protein
MGVRVIVAGFAAGAVLGATAAPAYAWPIPLTPDQNNFLNRAHGTGFPGDDDQLLIAGDEACHLLYSGQPTSAVIDSVGGEYGASPEQAAALVHSAHGALCKRAPG